jgi:hypothetical protein
VIAYLRFRENVTTLRVPMTASFAIQKWFQKASSSTAGIPV